MSDDGSSERGVKWWMVRVVVPIIIAIVAASGAYVGNKKTVDGPPTKSAGDQTKGDCSPIQNGVNAGGNINIDCSRK
jgi:hypothetical protein